jgi:TDG/mug DNA glycosylase family protein
MISHLVLTKSQMAGRLPPVCMKTLPDYLESGLRIVSIGLNPSLPSVAAGFYFANPRNRFWKALNSADLLPATVEPGTAAMRYLVKTGRIGFTDVVKRPTANASELRAADYREGARVLQEKLRRYAPAVAWFHGKVAGRNYLRYTNQTFDTLEWGKQTWKIGDTNVFVTPNPSPANAAYTLADLVDWYNALARVCK